MVTLQFVPFREIDGLGSARRVKKLLDIVKGNKIVLLEGKLKSEEEADLIAIAMEEIGKSKKFKGIELATIDSATKDGSIFKKVKQGVVGALLGDRQGFTIIGPATVVREIKQDPDKIQLLTTESKKRKR